MMRRRVVAMAVGLLAATACAAAVAVIANRDDASLDVVFIVLSLWLGLALGAVGGFLLALRPQNLLGPVLFVAGTALALEFSLRAYAYLGLVIDPRSVPAAAAAGWFGSMLDPLFFPASLVLTLLLFPDGRLPSRRWRPVAALCGVGVVLQVAVLALRSGPIGDESYGYVIPWRGAVAALDATTVTSVVETSTMALLLMILVAAVKLILQFRHAQGVERQQFRPLLLAVAVMIIGLLLQGGAATEGLGVALLVGGVALGLPAALAVAALRYRLWDVDRVIVATIVYAALAVLATAVYVAVVVTLAGLGGPDPEAQGVAPAVVATIAVALLFAPVRDRLGRAARRLVYGVRASPYEALAALPHRLADAPEIDDVLPQAAAALAGGLGVPAARIRAFLPDGSTQEAWCPPTASAPPTGDDADLLPAVPIRHLGETVGDIAVVVSPDRALGAAEQQLLSDLAAQAGPAVRGVGLTAQLRAQLAQITLQAQELRASRERLAVAQVAERRRLERDIHDGAQYQLVALGMQLKEVEERLADGRAGDTLELLHASQGALADCIDQLRELARGIYPPVLAARGLAAGLRARARTLPLPVTIEPVAPTDSARFDPTIELAAYFCCIEALQNALKHAPGAEVTVRLEATADVLCFEVADSGPGFVSNGTGGTGLVGMRDRLGAVGGEISVESAPGRGTRVRGQVPLRV